VAIAWNDLNDAVLYMDQIGPVPGFASSNVVLLTAMTFAQEMRDEPELQSALAVLLRHRWSQATDPRDHIYGLFGLLEREFRDLRLYPNYDLDTGTVYRQLAMAVLSNSQNLDLFSVPPVTSHVYSDLPSWVPDWSQSAGARSLLGLEGVILVNHDTTQSSKFPPLFSPDFQLVGVEGYFVDTITDLTSIQSIDNIEYGNVHTSWNKAIQEMSRKTRLQEKRHKEIDQVTQATCRKRYCTEDKMVDVLCMTKCAGIYKNGWEETREAFRKWRRSRRIIRWLYPIDRVFPIYYVFFSAAIALGILEAIFGVMNDGLLNLEVEFRKHHNSLDRRFFRTKKGLIGLEPSPVIVGDRIALCKGGKLPLVLRRARDNRELIGDCYIYGMVRGELWDADRCQLMWIA
jgi:hypothetical protein